MGQCQQPKALTCPAMSTVSAIAFRTAARQCAIHLADNAAYIERELPAVHLPPDLRAAVLSVCSDLYSTQHDLQSELDDWLDAPSASPLTDADRIDRLIRWLEPDLHKLNVLVERLHYAAEADPRCGLACLLVTESATNILRSATDLSAAAEQHRLATAP